MLVTLEKISDVTGILKSLIEYRILERYSKAVSPIAMPPDRLSAADHISVYLYHMVESAEFKNLPPQPRGGAVPVRYSPMGLVLDYVICTSLLESDSDTTACAKQDVMGWIAKTLHDYPVIEPGLTIDGHVVSPPGSPTLEVTMRPASREELMSYWGAQQDSLPRLTIFAEVRIALLEAERPTASPAPVLQVGTVASPGLAGLVVESTSSTLYYRRPGEPVSEMPVTPARPGLLDPADTPASSALVQAATSELRVRGAGFGAGTLALEWRIAGESFIIDLEPPHASNAAWGFEPGGTELRMSVRPEVTARGGAVRSLRPGAHACRVRTEDAEQRAKVSTLASFTVAPVVTRLTHKGGQLYGLTLSGHYLSHGSPAPVDAVTHEEIELAVAGTALQPPPPPPTPPDVAPEFALGEFRIAATNELEFLLDAETAASQPVVVVVVRGVASAPVWLEAGS